LGRIVLDETGQGAEFVVGEGGLLLNDWLDMRLGEGTVQFGRDELARAEISQGLIML
jgi:hypothetical protein